MIAFREAQQAGLYTRANISQNIVAGLVVGIVALPLAMAFAIASGVKPEQGLYTAIVTGIIVALFGGSRVQIAGPTGAFIVILSGITAKYGYEGLQIATIMGGLILMVLGFARMGRIIRFVPAPVVTGFTSGIALIIFVSQWKDFLGLKPEAYGDSFHEKVLSLVAALPQLHETTAALGLFSLALVVLSPRIFRRVPGPLVAMLGATALQSYFHFDGVATIGSAFGGIPHGIPGLHFPDITFSKIVQLVGPAFAIAGLGAIESLLSATVADGMAGTKHNSDQELVGQGLANIISPLFGGFTATGAIARTATNVRSGGNSPVAGITHSLVLVLIIYFLAPLAADIPLCALAAILFVVAWNMSDAPHFIRIVRRAPRNDVIVLLITFFLTVFVDLVVAVNVGVILAALMFMRRMMSTVRVESHTSHTLNKQIAPGVLVYTIEGPLFFGAVETFEKVLEAVHEEPRVVILCFRNVPFADITGLQSLQEAVERFHDRGTRVILCELNGRLLRKIQRIGLIRILGRKNIAPFLEKALALAAKKPE